MHTNTRIVVLTFLTNLDGNYFPEELDVGHVLVTKFAGQVKCCYNACETAMSIYTDTKKMMALNE
jgi:hypothetical protein